MMGDRTVAQKALFYSLNLTRHVPADHLLRLIDRVVDLSGIREHLRPFYSSTGRLSVDREQMIRTLIIGYCMGIRSERRLLPTISVDEPSSRLGLWFGVTPSELPSVATNIGRFAFSRYWLYNACAVDCGGYAIANQVSHQFKSGRVHT